MKQLKKFEFKTLGSDRQSYNWEKLLDGSIYQLEGGEDAPEGADYRCKTVTFQSLARSQANKRGYGLKTTVVDGGVVIQAVHGTEAEQAEILAKYEDAQARAKIAAQVRREKAKGNDHE